MASHLRTSNANDIWAEGPWYPVSKNVIIRSRSRSDLGKLPGHVESMTNHGVPQTHPPVSPVGEPEAPPSIDMGGHGPPVTSPRREWMPSDVSTPASMPNRPLAIGSEEQKVRGQIVSGDASVNPPEDGDEVYPIRRNHAYKRSEVPLRNHDGKMICGDTECAGLIFDRRCDWR